MAICLFSQFLISWLKRFSYKKLSYLFNHTPRLLFYVYVPPFPWKLLLSAACCPARTFTLFVVILSFILLLFVGLFRPGAPPTSGVGIVELVIKTGAADDAEEPNDASFCGCCCIILLTLSNLA